MYDENSVNGFIAKELGTTCCLKEKEKNSYLCAPGFCIVDGACIKKTDQPGIIGKTLEEHYCIF
jgi:hypothetical protein